MHVVVVTHFVSPYQVEIFNAVAALKQIDLQVVYLHRMFDTRHWRVPSLEHRSICLDEDANSFGRVQSDVLSADFTVFNYYAERPARVLLNTRAGSRKPWCFWGERPGFQKPEWIGRFVRRFFLSKLHNSQAPIWGIGEFAVQRYQEEFGRSRTYCNVPYFSDLRRFQTASAMSHRIGSERVFLFSGSLIPRKGLDLLGRAFLRLAHKFPNVRLRLLGDGELRRSMTHILQPVRDRVEFLGFKDWQELPAYYTGADILCVPSRYDGWGLVVPEGLAAGLPVIGTNCTGAAIEFLENDRNGWIIPAGDETALYLAMRRAALLPPEKLAKLSTHARESVSEHSLEHGAQRFIRAACDAMANWRS